MTSKKPEISEAQKSKMRNWQIYRVRGLYGLLPSILGDTRIKSIRAIIDDFLASEGLETQTAREGRLRREIEEDR